MNSASSYSCENKEETLKSRKYWENLKQICKLEDLGKFNKFRNCINFIVSYIAVTFFNLNKITNYSLKVWKT